jgi:hypothetical protein
MILTGAAVDGIGYRPATRVVRIAGWVSLALVLSYRLNSLVLHLSRH